MAEQDTSNLKVTNAVLKQELEHVKETLDRIEEKLDKLNGRVRTNETKVAVLESRQTRNDVIGTLLGFAAAIGAAIWGGSK